MKYHNLAFILCQLIAFSNEYITYDTGFTSSLNNDDGFIGNPNTNYIKEFTFSGIFERPPQVSIIMYKFNYDYYQPNGYDIEITEISKTNVFIRIEAPFNWYAYDDRRIQVINVVNYEIQQSSESFTTQIIHPHFNPNFSKGIVYVTSFCYKGPIDFSLNIVSINLKDVVIEIKSNTQNLVKLGYQILLSIDDAIDLDNQIVKNEDLYTSPTFSFPSDRDWNIGLQGLKWGQTINIRIKRIIYSNYYTYGKWSSFGNGVQVLRFTNIYFHRTISKIYLPWIIKTVRASQKENLIKLAASSLQLELKELNKVYAIPITETIYVNQISQLNIVIQYQFDTQKKKIKSQFYMCNSCSLKKQNYYCLRSANSISIFALLQSQMTAVSVFNIQFSNDAITISYFVKLDRAIDINIINISLEQLIMHIKYIILMIVLDQIFQNHSQFFLYYQLIID
ncbi:unnamed protein product [Paramecium sonneborni]|uniref:H-type lectin domain-containing protein n=1 Tax=Paramecium sonneborni TaxID=65129 RepID=A0A8S1PTU2_9CILI|nr:unnamed protein product [Paramecium sonneborni]